MPLRVFEAVARHMIFLPRRRRARHDPRPQSSTNQSARGHLGRTAVLAPAAPDRHDRDRRANAARRSARPSTLVNEASLAARQASTKRLVDFTPRPPRLALAGAQSRQFPPRLADNSGCGCCASARSPILHRDPADISIRLGVGPWPDQECHLLGRLSSRELSPGLADSARGCKAPEDRCGCRSSAPAGILAALGSPRRVDRPISRPTQGTIMSSRTVRHAPLAAQVAWPILHHIFFSEELGLGPVDRAVQSPLLGRDRGLAGVPVKPRKHPGSKVPRENHRRSCSRHSAHRAQTPVEFRRIEAQASTQMYNTPRPSRRARRAQRRGRRALLGFPPDATVVRSRSPTRSRRSRRLVRAR